MTTAAAAICSGRLLELRGALEERDRRRRGAGAVVDVSEIAKRKSFQAKMNTRMAAVNIPGAASGAMTLRNAWNGVAPSACAACSSYHGISRKNAERIQIASGNVKVRYGMISPSQVS